MTEPQAQALIFALADKARENCQLDWLSCKGPENAHHLAALVAIVMAHCNKASPEEMR